jgi:hypothetical protein
MGDLKRDSEVTLMKKFNGVMSFKKETDTKPTKYFRPAGATNEHTD